MVKNLNFTKFRNGDPVPEAKDAQLWLSSSNSPVYCTFNNGGSTPKIYGKLYNNSVAIDSRNIAPIGWRVPNLDDLTKLRDHLRNNSLTGLDLLIKSSDWDNSNIVTKSTGFSAYPSGYRDTAGDFIDAQTSSASSFIFWSSSVYGANNTSYALAV